MKLGSAIFLLAAKLIKQPESKDQTKRPSDPPKMMANNSENIREFILDFTSHFGEINPDTPNLCIRGLSGSKSAVIASFLSVCNYQLQ